MKNVDVETETSSINYRIPANDSPTCSVKLWKINAPIKAAHNDSQSQRSFPTRGEMNTTRGNFFSQRAKLEKLNFLDLRDVLKDRLCIDPNSALCPQIRKL